MPDLATILNMFNNPVVGMIQDDDNIHISTNKEHTDSVQERHIHRKELSGYSGQDNRAYVSSVCFLVKVHGLRHAKLS